MLMLAARKSARISLVCATGSILETKRGYVNAQHDASTQIMRFCALSGLLAGRVLEVSSMSSSQLTTALVALLLFTGCSEDTPSPDAGLAPTPDAGCLSGLACATWLQDYEREIVYKLAGGMPIAEGVTIAQRFTTEQRETVRVYLETELRLHDLVPERQAYGTGTNVFATLPATTETTATVLVGGHFDSIETSPAAGDNGTGTAIVLAAARYFADQPERPWNYLFVFFDEEEIGLIGSQAFADKIRTEQLDVRAVHNFDLVSWDEDGDGAVELWSPDPGLQALYEQVGQERGILVQSVEFDSSDHASFLGINLPTVGVSEEFVSGDFNPHYHTPEDTAEKIDYAYMQRISELAFEVLSIGPTATGG